MKIVRRRDPAEWAVFLLFAAAVIVQVFVPPVVGLANNGDFGKVIGIFSLTNPQEDEFGFLTLKFRFDPERFLWVGYASSEQLLAASAVALNAPFGSNASLDVRMVGAVHVALYLLSFYLLLPLLRGFPRLRWLAACVLILFVFTDVMYVSWMNSFFMDAASLLFLLLTIVLYLRSLAWRRTADYVGCAIFAALFATSKAQHCVLAIPIAMLLWVGWGSPWPQSRRIIVAGMILTAAVLSWVALPRNYAATTLFNVIFFEILPRSQDAVQDLHELGLDDSDRRWIGKHAFSEGVDFDRSGVADHVSERTSRARIAWFFFRHPWRAYETLVSGLNVGGRQRLQAGNFARETEAKAYQESRSFAMWSDLKRRMFLNHAGRYLAYFSGMGATLLIVAAGRHGRRAFLSAACLFGMALLALGIAGLGDLRDVRHFFLFNVMTDVMLVGGLLALLHPRTRRQIT